MRITVPAAIAALALPIVAVAATTAPGSAVPGAAPCDPFTNPVYAGNVPSPTDVLGFELGSQEVTSDEAETYLRAVADASPDVKGGVMAVSGQGRELWYAVVGKPKDVKAAQAAAKVLRNPKTSKAKAARIADRAPAIAWVASNVHGNEESGTDAALQVLRDLTDRTDCAARTDPRRRGDGDRADPEPRRPRARLSAQLLRVRPQPRLVRPHPAGDRRQAAVAAQVPLGALHRRPRDGRRRLLLPAERRPGPPRDRRSVDLLDQRPLRRLDEDQFTEQDIPFFNYDIYDLLYMGYGDTVPTTGFLGAGMTFEKNNADPIQDRVHEQYVALWTSLTRWPARRTRCCRGWAASYRQAYSEGVRGKLEPNAVFAPGSVLEQEVPDEKIRSYFIPRSKAKAADVQNLIRRLQRMDVKVRVLTKPLRCRTTASTAPNATRPSGCLRARTTSRWRRRRSTGSRRCSARTATCRSRTSTT